MIILGLLLLVLALIFGADLVWQNHFAIPGVRTFGIDLGLGNSAALFIVGAITGAAIVLGVALMAAGAARKARKAVDHHHRDDEAERLEAENRQLRSDLDRQPEVTEKVVTRPATEKAVSRPATEKAVSRPATDRVVRTGAPDGDRPGATRSDSTS